MNSIIKIDLLSELSNISTIPTLPTVVEKITKLLQDPQTSAEEIGQIITTDQALTSKVLKLVNSAFYGFPGRISTISHAVVILGFATIKNIVLTASIFDSFRNNSPANSSFDMEKFWLHSIACGAAAQTIAKHIKSDIKEMCFIAGLIHDIGKIVLCQYLPKHFDNIIKKVKDENILFYDAEVKTYNITHQEIGGFIAKKWNLPEELENVVSYHHKPSLSHEHNTITAVVHAANILVRALDYGNGGDQKIPYFNSSVWQKLQLNQEKISTLLEEIELEVDKASIFLQI